VVVKGVILAGGTGSRLYPLTRITNKHLLPIYDRPMIAWSIEALVSSGIDEIMLVTGGPHAGEFLRCWGTGASTGSTASPTPIRRRRVASPRPSVWPSALRRR
jgi:glucose-1-phosphate thymidylyltransferase